jgi:hypothetical protein
MKTIYLNVSFGNPEEEGEREDRVRGKDRETARGVRGKS